MSAHTSSGNSSSMVGLIFILPYGPACRLLRQNATRFLLDDLYRNPGPIQFDGPGGDAKAVTLCVEDRDYMGRIKELQVYLDKVLKFLLCLNSLYACAGNTKNISHETGTYVFFCIFFYLNFMCNNKCFNEDDEDITDKTVYVFSSVHLLFELNDVCSWNCGFSFPRFEQS